MPLFSVEDHNDLVKAVFLDGVEVTDRTYEFDPSTGYIGLFVVPEEKPDTWRVYDEEAGSVEREEKQGEVTWTPKEDVEVPDKMRVGVVL